MRLGAIAIVVMFHLAVVIPHAHVVKPQILQQLPVLLIQRQIQDITHLVVVS